MNAYEIMYIIRPEQEIKAMEITEEVLRHMIIRKGVC